MRALEIDAERRTAIMNAVSFEPSTYSKSSLIKDALRIPGPFRDDWFKVVDKLVKEGKLTTVGQYHKLTVPNGS